METKDSLNNNSDIHKIAFRDKEIHLIGTAHISQESVDLVRSTILSEQPDSVYIELDEKRFQSLLDKNRWEKLNLKEVIKKKQLSSLIVSLVMGSYQKRMGNQMGVQPGSELLEAYKVSQEVNKSYKLIDRDVGTTLQRVWRKTPFFKKMVLLSSLFASLFEKTEVNEEELKKIKEQDAMTMMLNEMEEQLPSLKRTLIDERDQYMAYHLMNNEDQKIVAVVGAGHVPGMKRHIENESTIDIHELNVTPPKSLVSKALPWLVPSIIIGGFLFLLTKDTASAKEGLLIWTLVNGIPASLGALIALAHPLVILTAFLAAPLTSLNPLLGVGLVTAFVQTWISPPTVSELQQAGDQMGNIGNWWKNRFLKIILAFFLPTLGSAIGTWLGAADLLQRIIP